VSSGGDESKPAIARPEPDTLERKVFEARLEARLLGGEPELPRVDRFVLERMLGSGGMGTVWLARDEISAGHVALKVVRGQAGGAGERMRLREARGLASVSHPNVIGLVDVGEHEGRVWLAMDYVPGATLRECAAELERERVLSLWIDAGRGLAAIHAANLVHRDVKPDNVLLGDDGRVRVIDLGLVREISRAPPPARSPAEARALELVVTPGFVGTRSYAAPEQLRGEPLDARADQYAFCVALLESLRAAKPPPGREDEPLDDALLALLARGRAPLPAQRFVDMHALLDALLATRRPAWRRHARVLVVALVILSILSILSILVMALAW
jgi:serine/threonine protein kinase